MFMMMTMIDCTTADVCHFRAHALTSHNQSVSQPVSAAKFNAAGDRPTLVMSSHVTPELWFGLRPPGPKLHCLVKQASVWAACPVTHSPPQRERTEPATKWSLFAYVLIPLEFNCWESWYLVVKSQCQFLLLNDIFDWKAINCLLTYYLLDR